MSIWEVMAAPAVSPYPEIKLIVLTGNPASLINSQILRADNGVASADLMTTVFPVAIAGDIFQINIKRGKRHIVVNTNSLVKI